MASSAGTLTVKDDSGVSSSHRPLPAEHDPLPIGEWEVRGVARDPAYHYNPDLFWTRTLDRQGHDRTWAQQPRRLGVIDITKEHYCSTSRRSPPASATTSLRRVRLTTGTRCAWPSW